MTIVSSIREQDRIVVVVEFTTDDEIPEENRLILERGQYRALRQSIESDLMIRIREVVASWTTDTGDRYALGVLLDLLGLEIHDPYVPENDPDIVWVCASCRRSVVLSDGYVAHRSDDKTIIYHAACEP